MIKHSCLRTHKAVTMVKFSQASGHETAVSQSWCMTFLGILFFIPPVPYQRQLCKLRSSAVGRVIVATISKFKLSDSIYFSCYKQQVVLITWPFLLPPVVQYTRNQEHTHDSVCLSHTCQEPGLVAACHRQMVHTVITALSGVMKACGILL